ncbi:LssY C-terminal domain-containing protein [Pseudorhodoplanes sp.]|uniref:LssY C-terminal domain-containing protein n=1 Tax=Pseudorhodoplanes sp. TaxID=1934341 RepID=UPI002B6A21E2|nr:LssY C-terminal domain-containing protein [Pseudorhodoplanes sp.]HWV52352.1 LssY C-terminal domain-containing protein [Pseudorhodoplanes sp.]
MFTAAVVALIYGAVAYLILPAAWKHFEHQPGLATQSMVTHTKQGIPGDALNVGLVGERATVIRAMNEAGWFPADPITLKSSVEIIGSVLLDRPYKHAPVSPLYYDGRVEDLAFEKPSGKSADRRHHVRFWQVLAQGAEKRPVWLGSVTFDRGVGLSHYTGQVTHHISPDIDAERDGLIDDLKAAKVVEAIYQVTGVGPTLNGRNGEGDSYWTDGELDIARLTPDAVKTDKPPQVLDSPQIVQWKDAVMKKVGQSFGN